jgi:hypothetical protein
MAFYYCSKLNITEIGTDNNAPNLNAIHRQAFEKSGDNIK